MLPLDGVSISAGWACMKKGRIANKLVLRIVAVLVFVLGVVFWGIGKYCIDNVEASLSNNMGNMAKASRDMLHSAAEELCTKNGMKFYRVLPDDFASHGDMEGDFTRMFSEFQHNSGLEMLTETVAQKDGAERIYTLVPVLLRNECHVCHEAYGIDKFAGVSDGTLIGAFGVSATTEGLKESKRTLVLYCLLGALASVAILVFLIRLFVTNMVLRPLTDFSHGMDIMARGDLRVTNSVDSNDEIGRVGSLLGGAMDSLRTLFGRIKDCNSEVETHIGELDVENTAISRVLGDMSKISDDLHTSGVQAVAAIRELSRNIEAMAEQHRLAEKESVAAQQDALMGLEDGNTAVARMNEINRATEQIAKAIKVIQDIARQTNLLSLNAAIEAAKAGAQGRGFAVVADQVRRLAERSIQASHEIESLLEQTESTVNQGVESVASTLGRIEATKNKVALVSSKMKEIAALGSDQYRCGRHVSGLIGVTADCIMRNNSVKREINNEMESFADALKKLEASVRDMHSSVEHIRI